MNKFAITCFFVLLFFNSSAQHLDKETPVNILTSTLHHKITGLMNGQQFPGEIRKPGMSYIEKNRTEKNVFSILIKPHAFRYLRWSNKIVNSI